MRDLQTKRIRFSNEADTWLKVLKTRTGLTPNILCRLGFTLSLMEPGVPNPPAEDEISQREISRYTLLGEYDKLFVALLKQWMYQQTLAPEKFEEQFNAHMHRGISLMSTRVKSLSDIATLV